MIGSQSARLLGLPRRFTHIESDSTTFTAVIDNFACRQVFLASPGGLGPERLACREVFRAHNESDALETKSFFFVHAWEDVSGGVGRAQGRINPLMDECDYTIVIFHDRWGSPPATGGKYTSGTEEEFYRAIEMLGDVTKSMRDLLVLFKDVDAERMRDPGADLQKVLDFRTLLEQPNNRGLMFETFDSVESLRHKIARKMREWAKESGEKHVVEVSLVKSSGESRSLENMDLQQVLESAREFTEQELYTQAEACYAAASVGNDPKILLEFGQFMRRRGRSERAMELNRRVVEDVYLLTSSDRGSAAFRVRAMTNIGVLQRQLGEIGPSLETLAEAVRTAEVIADPIPNELCYALDNYGHSLLRTGAIEPARRQFERSRGIRTETGTREEKAQAAINLGRLLLDQGLYDDCLAYFAEALSLLGVESDGHLRANALCGKSEALIRAGAHESALPLLGEAFQINEALSNKKGVGIVLGLQARCALAVGELGTALSIIEKVRENSEVTADVQGIAVVALLRAEYAIRSKDDSARSLLDDASDAVSEASDSGLKADLERVAQLVQDV